MKMSKFDVLNKKNYLNQDTTETRVIVPLFIYKRRHENKYFSHILFSGFSWALAGLYL